MSCPLRDGTSACPDAARRSVPVPTPTWDDDISKLFSAPYWLPESSRHTVGSGWISAMNHYGPWDLSSYATVKETVTSIYQHLRSRSMPLTDDASHYFPLEALEMIRSWANQGFRRSSQDGIVPQDIIKEPEDIEVQYRVRKDIRSLTKEELQTYRERLDTVLNVGDIQGKWQELGLLHANWCLHYQEATFLWHRAYLRYVEELIDFPIPYWNGLCSEAADPTSPFSGLPAVFLEDSYTHRTLGARKNPLKYALLSLASPPRYVLRDPILVSRTPGPDWDRKIRFFGLYQSQIRLALRQDTFSQPMNVMRPFGKPWANILQFTEDLGDELYPNRTDFDGLFEQPHDNIHGWVGPDMANGSFTAFDPVFLSFHSNIDRITEMYIRSRPGLMFTATYPLRPFIDNARGLSYDEPREWVYTTIGDMVKDTKSIGYMYAPPASLDQVSPALPSTAIDELLPSVVFHGVGCNLGSFHIDVFTPSAASLVPDPVENPDYIGRDTRLGMGPGSKETGLQNTDRCVKKGVTRTLDAERWVETLRKESGKSLRQVVVELKTGREVPEQEWTKLSGFRAEVVWGRRL